MKRILDAIRAASFSAGAFLSLTCRRAVEWLSVSVNFCFSLIAGLFLASFLVWALADRYEEVVLFFPDEGGTLQGELRDLPRSEGKEGRAELVAAEALLGPLSPNLVKTFEAGTKLEAVLYREGRLYVDLAQQAALAEPKALALGLKALSRSLEAALPGLKELTITIGGWEPYREGLSVQGGNGAKKEGI